MDKVQSIYQGRPTRLRECDTNVPIAFLDDSEELDNFNYHTYSTEEMNLGIPKYGNSTFEQFSKLSIVVDRILRQLYTVKGTAMQPDESWKLVKSLDGQLDLWLQDVPRPTRALFHSLKILIYRASLSEGRAASISEAETKHALLNCVTAALEVYGILMA
ncbi:hypothetical protein NW768_008660 [Fusarium equiseti]|uniref:Xylanolytic transcriptional activator regulatory domain-containing protein n=1 Tax=Fusarium equiseti TaxID=61235 RepID=A0ABQ8R4P9_FUSEQ|nr:hypothetical protein NW768_008660 [Fusarium equiseti]